MKLPVKQLRKKDLEYLATHHCKHRHSYLSHYSCYIEEAPEDSPFQEYVGFFDIETTGLKADFHYVLSYAIRTNKGELIGRVLTPKEIRDGVFDKALLKEMCADLAKFHRVVTHYGTDYKFDIPFVRSRCVKYGYDFPLYRDVFVTDTQPILKSKFCLSSNRLAAACRHFGIPAKAHPLDSDTWQAAGIGQEDALHTVWLHNTEDVDSTRALYEKISPYVLQGRRSI